MAGCQAFSAIFIAYKTTHLQGFAISDDLTDQQKTSIELLASGMKVQDVADAVGVTRKCLHDWKSRRPVYATALARARLEALSAHTIEAREIVGGVWAKLAHRFADFDDKWDDLTWGERIKVMEMMLKHFQTPDDKTTYRREEKLTASIKWPDTGIPPDAIEATATPVDDDESE